MVLLWPLWEINMHADNLAEDIWAKCTEPKHVSNQKLYDGLKVILGLQLTPQTPRNQRHLQQLFITFMLNFICHLVCPEFYIIRVSYAYKLAFALIIHWHHWRELCFICLILYTVYFETCWVFWKQIQYCNWSSDYFGRTTVAIKYNIPDSNQFYTVVIQ